MSVTMRQVLAELDRDEPDYAGAARLGPDALPHLRLIIEADDALRASKAVYLASLIPGSVDLLRLASVRPEPEIRVTVAHALRNVSAPGELLGVLLEDSDAGVRKVTLASVANVGPPELRERVAALAENDPEEFVRELAARTVRGLDR